MWLKKDVNLTKTICSVISFGYLFISSASAQELDCSHSKNHALKTVCSASFQTQKQKLEVQSTVAYIVTDAPLQLLKDTQYIWLNTLQQCKRFSCYQQQIDNRIDQLNFFSSLNQSLTQHYLKVENGQLSKQLPTHIQIHQLSKNNIKIEGIAYRNPNNKLDKQTLSLLAYSTPENKTEIIDNNNNCTYQFKYTKAYLSIRTKQKACENFVGLYRLYD